MPGGARLPMAAVSMVTVHPTHRRRGVLRRVMDAQLDDVARRGEPLAGLTASEASIYERFGYGTATFTTSWELESDYARLQHRARRRRRTRPHRRRRRRPRPRRTRCTRASRARASASSHGPQTWWPHALRAPRHAARASSPPCTRAPTARPTRSPATRSTSDWPDGVADRRCACSSSRPSTPTPKRRCGTTSSASTWWARSTRATVRSTTRCAGGSPIHAGCASASCATTSGCASLDVAAALVGAHLRHRRRARCSSSIDDFRPDNSGLLARRRRTRRRHVHAHRPRRRPRAVGRRPRRALPRRRAGVDARRRRPRARAHVRCRRARRPRVPRAPVALVHHALLSRTTRRDSLRVVDEPQVHSGRLRTASDRGSIAAFTESWPFVGSRFRARTCR